VAVELSSGTSGEATSEQVMVGPTALHLLRGGQGRPCLVLHGIEGHEGWLAFHGALAEQTTVYAPSHPGYGHTDCPAWISSVQHQAVFYNWFLEAADVREVDLVGIGLGGWIAAEMAVMCTDRLRHLVLVDAAGIKPAQDDRLDIFVTPWRTVIERGFSNAKSAPEYTRLYGSDGSRIADFGGVREAGRTMTMRMCFRPYLYDPALPDMLGKIRCPTLIVWGKQDQIVPLECAERYQRAIAGAQLRILDPCGHFAHLEQPTLLARSIAEFTNP
jgi:pimeloyl-ACP methyl ester carboxylesterase